MVSNLRVSMPSKLVTEMEGPWNFCGVVGGFCLEARWRSFSSMLDPNISDKEHEQTFYIYIYYNCIYFRYRYNYIYKHAHSKMEDPFITNSLGFFRSIVFSGCYIIAIRLGCYSPQLWSSHIFTRAGETWRPLQAALAKRLFPHLHGDGYTTSTIAVDFNIYIYIYTW